MANENKVVLEIEVDSKDAQAAIELFGSSAVKTVKEVEKASKEANRSFKDSFKDFGAPIVAAQAAVSGALAAIRGGIELFSAAINEAAEDQKQFIQIKDALRITQEGTDEATKSIVAFADALEESTGVGDELVKQLFINSKAFGISTEAAKELTRASIDYAAATGIDVESANRILGQTIDGTVGKLGLLGEEFRNLTEAQLKNGDAIALVASRYAGAAASQLDTFAGSTKTLANSFSDLLKEIGRIVTESPAIITALRGVGSAVDFITNIVKIANNQDDRTIKARDEAARKIVEQNELIGNSTIAASKSFSDLVNESSKTSSSKSGFATFGEQISNSAGPAIKSIELTGKALEEFNKKAAKEAEELKKNRDELSKFLVSTAIETGDDITKARIKTEESIKKIDELALKAGLRNAKEVAQAKKDLSLKLVQDIAKINEESLQKEADRQRRAAAEEKRILEENLAAQQKARDRVASAAADPGVAALKGLTNPNEYVGVGVGIAAGIAKGTEGAKTLISKTIGAIADAYIPGIGSAVAEIVGFLGGSQDNVRQQVRGFVESQDEFIQAIAENIPVFVETFIDSFITKGGAIRIARASLEAFFYVPTLKKIGAEISNGFKTLDTSGFNTAIKEGLQEFFDALSNFGSNIVQGLIDFFNGFFKNIGDIFKPLTDSIGSLLQPINDLISALKGGRGGGQGILSESLGKIGINTGSGGGSGIIAESFSKLGFATGTDSVPAMLTPGERVVPVDSNIMLAKFLAKQESPTGSNEALLSQILGMVSQPMVVQAEAKVNQSAFADIILQLNRQNARLSA